MLCWGGYTYIYFFVSLHSFCLILHIRSKQIKLTKYKFKNLLHRILLQFCLKEYFKGQVTWVVLKGIEFLLTEKTLSEMQPMYFGLNKSISKSKYIYYYFCI